MTTTTPRRLMGSILASVKRIGRSLAVTLAIAVSLLTFPGGIVIMAACWLMAYTVIAILGRRSVWMLAIPTAVILGKRVDWPVGLVVFLLMVVAVILLDSVSSFRTATRLPRWSLPTMLWLAWLGFAIDFNRAIHINHIPAALEGRPVVCLGDSLTSYTRGGGYPEVLAEMTTAPVINLAQPGITSSEALKKLPEMIAARPRVVIVELGGHDFLKDTSLLKIASRAAAKRNLEKFIFAAKDLGAAVILIEVPRGFVVDPYAGLERQLAREHDLELVSDTTFRRFVLGSPAAPPGMWFGGPYLSDDGLHPNSRGNLLLARRLLATLKRLYAHSR
jgi:acyl-CoA thioesterase I